MVDQLAHNSDLALRPKAGSHSVCVGFGADRSGKDHTSLRFLIIWFTVGTPSRVDGEAGGMEDIRVTLP